MWSDVHSHPYQLDDVVDALERAEAGGVSCIIAAVEKPSEVPPVRALKSRFPELLLFAAGLHPATAIGLGEAETNEELAQLPDALEGACAVGEIGLDFMYAKSEEQKAFQKTVLAWQLDQAADHELPVQLHSRRAQRQTMDVAIEFAEKTGLPALLHWFTHSRKLARITNEKGIFVSVGPAVLYDENTQKVVKEIALECLLLETDCPVRFGGKPNEPANVVKVAEKVAEVHGIDLNELSERLAENLGRYLRA